jgi:hypothetical protein
MGRTSIRLVSLIDFRILVWNSSQSMLSLADNMLAKRRLLGRIVG